MIRDKKQMYKLLAAGLLGNTIPQFFSVREWWESGDALKYPFWGVRSLTPGGPAKFYVPTEDVPLVVSGWACPYNISMMVDAVATVTAWLEVLDGGKLVEGVEYPDTAAGETWRSVMPDPSRRKQWRGSAAKMILAKHLNENSRDDIDGLSEKYPDHVIELTAADRCMGMLPHRNGIIWEIRAY